MKKMLLLAAAASLFAVGQASAQDAVVDDLSAVPCGTRYYSTWNQNWFVEVGAGFNIPFVENATDADRHFTANYGVGFGKWFSPYFGWRMEFAGGSLHWNPMGKTGMAHAKSISGNLDVMWDMFNSLGGVNTKRVFSIVPFIGLGGTYNWDFRNIGVADASVYPMDRHGHVKSNEWTLPVSAGIQFRFRLSSHVDFFLQARAQFYGDNYNNEVCGRPIDVNLSGLGGFTFNIGGSSFNSIDPCDYTSRLADANAQINALRGELLTTAAALAAAEAQLPCPEVKEAEAVVIEQAPLLSTVRFKIDSSKISDMEQVNVYNVAEWLKANDDQNLIITGYADKDTGTAKYNQALSERRAKAVYDMLVNEYGINPNRLTQKAEGSATQLYNVNNWNRIVVFSVAE
ncbi:MAG: OmpA family protein [Clostridium sp.]|nr:OmpA family protein [Clostridium sp.]